MYNFYNHKLLVLLVAMICTFSLSAQLEVTLDVDGTQFGPYDAFSSSFGPQIDPCGDTFTGPVEIAVDITGSTLGCDSIAMDLTGKIAIIDRGTCAFVDKVFGAQTAGAIAVIIVSDDRDPGPPGGTSDEITIPTVMISNMNGNELKNNVTEDAIASIGSGGATFDSRDIVLWGAEQGQGDFSGGLNGWTPVNYTTCTAGDDFTLFQYTADGSTAGGCGGTSIASPTSCDGAISFNSDYYDNAGVGCGVAIDSICSAPQEGTIISPSIDISGSADIAGVAVSFYQVARTFTSTTYWVGWSIDGGATWDSTQINQDYVVNASPVQEFERVNLPNSVIGASDLRIKFTLAPANYYYWIIDDVRIIEREANNIKVNEFYAIPTNAVTPQSQVEAFGFLADIENVGASAQEAVNLNVTVLYEDGSVVYTNDLDYGMIASDSIAENQPFEGEFTPDQIGLYQGFYTVTSENEDFDETDNQQDFFFFVSDTTFAKEYALESGGGDLTGIVVDFDENPTWAYGNYFYVPNGDGYNVTSVTLAVSNPAEIAGLTVIAAIFKWDDANQDQVAQADERLLLGFKEYEIKETDVSNAPINIPFNEEGDDPILLEDNSSYLVMNVANGPISITSSSGVFDYLATNLLTTLDADPRYAGFIGLSNDLTGEEYSPVYEFTPFVRMHINTNPVNVEETLTVDNKINLFPNPTNDQLTVSLGLQEVSENVRLRVYDMTGKLISQTRLENIKDQQFTFNTSNLQSGLYIMEIMTDFGVRSEQFEVAR